MTILGVAQSGWKYGFNELVFRMFLWMYDFNERHPAGHEIFCKAQAPFRLLSFGLWTFVPLNWVCVGAYQINPERNHRINCHDLRRGAAALGGNAVVVFRQFDRVVIHSTGHRERHSESRLNGLAVRADDDLLESWRAALEAVDLQR